MTIDIDPYSVLDVPGNASDEQIREAHKKQSRIWAKRAVSGDPSVREEAELRVGRLDTALDTLLDPARRPAFDGQRSRNDVQPSPAPTPVGGRGSSANWVEQAKDALAEGDYHSAAYAAREATHSTGDSAEAWILRSRANAGLGKLDDALYEVRQAITIEPHNPDFHFHAGLVHEELSQWEGALSSYRTAARLAPDEFIYPLAVGSVLLQNGLIDEALLTIEPVHAAYPTVRVVNFYLAQALLDKAESVPAMQGDGAYQVSSPGEITTMRALVGRAASLGLSDDDVDYRVRHIADYLDRMEKRTWAVPRFPFGYSTFKAVAIPLVLGVVAFMLFNSGAAGAGFVLLLFAVAAGGTTYGLCWVPGWKVNRRARQ